MQGHLLSRGNKIQEIRVRESMKRCDPEGTVVRALQIRVTHRRSYNVRAPLSLLAYGRETDKVKILCLKPFYFLSEHGSLYLRGLEAPKIE